MAGYIENRGENKWRLVVSCGTDAAGKRIKKTKTIEAKDKGKAEKQLALFIAEVESPNYQAPTKLTFEKFCKEHWLKNYAEIELAPKTVVGYKESLKRIYQAIGHIKLDKIRPTHLVEFYANLREDGVRKDKKAGGLSELTILQYHRLIFNIFNTAVRWQIIASNPAQRVNAPKVPKKHMKIYDEETIRRLLDALEKARIKHRAIVVLALGTGLRLGEIMGLEWSDVNLENSTLRVRQASQYLPDKGLFLKTPKNETSKREIDLPNTLVELLKEYKAHQEEQRLNLGDKWTESNRVFTGNFGKPLNPGTASQWFRDFLGKNNLPHMPFHGLRHTSATVLVEKGLPSTNISARLGHSETTTTMRIYAHAMKKTDKIAAQKLDEVLSKK